MSRDFGAFGHAVVRRLPFLEKELLDLPRFVAPDAVCIDVGASYGVYTVVLSRLVGPGGQVIAIEPRPRSLHVLRTARALLGVRNVRILPIAVSDRAGGETLVTPRRRWLLPVPGRTFLKGGMEGSGGDYYDGWRDEFGGAAEVDVPTATLDDVVQRARLERLDLIKIDVEGAELRVLHGAADALRRWRPVVICEIEDRHTRKYGHGADDVLRALTDLGYRALVFTDPGHRQVTTVDPAERNHVFVPEESIHTL